MTLTVLSTVGLAIAAALVACLWRAVGVVARRFEAPQPLPEPTYPMAVNAPAADEVERLQTQIDNLKLAVEDGILRVHRAETRIAKTVTNARRLVRNAGLEHEGLEAEHEEIRDRDAEGIEELPAMLEAVGETRTVRIPGGSLTLGVS